MTSPTDIVDYDHQDRDCPYCGRRQIWFDSGTDPHYFHADDNRRYCDEERLALWDMAESLKATKQDGVDLEDSP